MASNYYRRLKTKPNTFPQIMRQVDALRKYYPTATFKPKKGEVIVYIRLQPTDYSVDYLVELRSRVGESRVKVYVTRPRILMNANGRKIPHLYSDGSLCLYYPPNCEWDYRDLWVETLIPWTLLWLYYYEIWDMTGEWLGGGVHEKGNKLER